MDSQPSAWSPSAPGGASLTNGAPYLSQGRQALAFGLAPRRGRGMRSLRSDYRGGGASAASASGGAVGSGRSALHMAGQAHWQGPPPKRGRPRGRPPGRGRGRGRPRGRPPGSGLAWRGALPRVPMANAGNGVGNVYGAGGDGNSWPLAPHSLEALGASGAHQGRGAGYRAGTGRGRGRGRPSLGAGRGSGRGGRHFFVDVAAATATQGGVGNALSTLAFAASLMYQCRCVHHHG
jgi:hypothetical protein